jgi:hypothetical protein
VRQEARERDVSDQYCNRREAAERQKTAQREGKIAVDEDRDRNDVEIDSAARRQGVERKRAKPDQDHDRDQRLNRDVPAAGAPPLHECGERGHQESRVGERIDRLGPECRACALAIEVDRFGPVHSGAKLSLGLILRSPSAARASRRMAGGTIPPVTVEMIRTLATRR